MSVCKFRILRGQHLVRQLMTKGKINDLNRATIDRIAEQEKFEGVMVCVGVDSGLGKVHGRKGLDVNEKFMHTLQLLRTEVLGGNQNPEVGMIPSQHE